MSSPAVSLSVDPRQNRLKPDESASREAAQSASQSLSIEQLAYTLWIQRGSPEGSPEVDWAAAEEQLQQGVTPQTATGR